VLRKEVHLAAEQNRAASQGLSSSVIAPWSPNCGIASPRRPKEKHCKSSLLSQNTPRATDKVK